MILTTLVGWENHKVSKHKKQKDEQIDSNDVLKAMFSTPPSKKHKSKKENS